MLVLLGCIHNFVAAPMTYKTLTTQALWFIAAGLALWYAGFINLVRAQHDRPDPLLSTFCVLTNLSLLSFVVMFASVRGNWAAPEALLLVGTVAALTLISFLSLLRIRGGPAAGTAARHG